MAKPEETQEPSEEPSDLRQTAIPKTRQSFSKVRRELSDEELAAPAVQKMLIDEIERLERENDELSVFRERFHTADKRASLLEEKGRKSLSGEVSFAVALTIGAGAITHAISLLETSAPTAWLLIAFGIILIVGGIASRVVQR